MIKNSHDTGDGRGGGDGKGEDREKVELQVRKHKLYVTLYPPDTLTVSFRRELGASK